MKALVLVLIAAAVLAFGAGSAFTPPSVTSTRLPQPVVAASRDAGDDGGVDTYGSEVASAVAEYSLDPAGTLYELHSPQVELPRLGSPKS